MTTIESMISPELKRKVNLTPLKEGETAEFVLINAGVYDKENDRFFSPQGRSMEGREMIWDPGLNTNVLIMNITGHSAIKQPGRETVYEPQYEYVRFPSTGRIVLTHQENNKLFFLRLSNKNRDNPNRVHAPKGKAITFYEHNPVKEFKLKVNEFEFSIIAGQVLIGLRMAGGDELQEFAKRLNAINKKSGKLQFDVANRTKEALYGELTAYCVNKNNSVDVIMASSDSYSKTRVLIENAIDKFMIMYTDEKDGSGEWSWVEGKKDLSICKVEPGNDPSKALADYLNTKEGAKQRAMLFDKHKNYAGLEVGVK